MLSRSDLARELGVGRVTLWRWQREGVIPAPERISRTQVAYCPEAVAAIRVFAEAAQ
ncbi:helix-turn-helix transcriptional regulator [Hyphomicrobium denitrificans]|uniref:helix-turn-helix transcriptional regulator n=1 Tax=Hyphomicrobium denitrificans TaxID=53399 RepID=UPI0001B0EDE1